MKKYLPLFLVEGYLLFTLVIYNFGPVHFTGHNSLLFVLVMALCHLGFILGYCIASEYEKPNSFKLEVKFSSSFFYVSFFLGVIGILNTYKNLMLSQSIIPYDIINEVVRGLDEPGAVYAERIAQLSSVGAGSESASRFLNVVSIFFAFFKLFFIYMYLYFWRDIGFFKRLLSVLYSLLFISAGVSSGTNSVVFIFFIFFIFSLLTILYVRRYRHFSKIMISMVLLFFIPLGGFGYIMSQRGGGFDYFASTSPLGDISVLLETPALDSIVDFYYYSLVWMNYYLVQGYYGFSLILSLDWNWTYGFGNSAFLQRQLLVLTGVDVAGLTFQSRVSDVWDVNAQWHSFYGQFANDFGFVGLALLMCFLGYFLARVWLSIIYNNSFYGVALIPLFMLMFVFFPANNQVFGYIDTLSYFIFVGALWLFEGKRIRFI
ncbi:MAG: hypothetical protein RPT25_06010 [Cycloclasticus sp.]